MTKTRLTAHRGQISSRILAIALIGFSGMVPAAWATDITTPVAGVNGGNGSGSTGGAGGAVGLGSGTGGTGGAGDGTDGPTQNGTDGTGGGGAGGGFSPDSNTGGASGGGGAGVGGSGGGGGGGSGIAETGTQTITNSSTITGGSGGSGAFTGAYGSGGGGGDGIIITSASSVTITNQTGGFINAGGGGGGSAIFGAGGGGGNGIEITGTGTTIVNAGSISGGGGGYNGGASGDGILVTGGSTTLTNSGSISGDVVLDASSVNTVTLTAGGSISGNLNIGSQAGSTLTLNGAGTQVYSAAVTGTTTFAGALTESGTGTWAIDVAFAPTSTTISSGTLQIGNGGTIGSLSGSISDSGTLAYDRTDAITVSNSVSGSGGLTQAGSGTLTLSGNNFTYTGATLVSAGTLALSSGADISDSTSVVISNGAVLDLSASTVPFVQNLAGGATSGVVLGSNTLTVTSSSDTTYAGVISGAGGLTKSGSSTLILSGNNTYAGATTVSAGTLQIGNGGTTGAIAGNLVDNSAVIFDRSDTVTNSSTITGNGTLQQSGSGTLVLTGTSSAFTGATQVSAGSLEVDGTLGDSSTTVTVASGASVGGSGTLGGNLNVLSGGTLAPGDPVTLHIGGNLTLNSGSNTLFQVASTSNYDKVVVGGTATLGGNLLIQPIGGFVPTGGESFTFITATGGVSGQFSGVTNTLGNALTYTYNYNSNDFTVTIGTQQNSFTPFAHNPNQGAVARNLDAVSSDPRMSAAIDYLNSLPGSQLPAALNAIAPTSQTVAAPIAFNDGRASFRTIDSRLSAIRGGASGLDLSQVNLIDSLPLNSLMAGTDDAPMTSKPFIPGPNNKWGFFAAADGDFGDIDGQNGAPNSNYYGAGGNAGVDYRLDQNFAIGFQAGYNKDKDDFSNTSAISADTVRFGPYATWHDRTGDWVNAQVGGAYHWYDSQRDSLDGTASGKDTGTEFDASAKYGHDFKLGQWTLTPSFGFDYIELDTAAFSETGSLTPLSLDSQETESLQSTLDGTVAYEFKWKEIAWQPYVSAGWNHEFLNTGSSATARFASGAGGLFTVNGYDVGRESATFGAGLQATLTQSVTATLGYSGQANNDFLDNSLQAGIRWQF